MALFWHMKQQIIFPFQCMVQGNLGGGSRLHHSQTIHLSGASWVSTGIGSVLCMWLLAWLFAWKVENHIFCRNMKGRRTGENEVCIWIRQGAAIVYTVRCINFFLITLTYYVCFTFFCLPNVTSCLQGARSPDWVRLAAFRRQMLYKERMRCSGSCV